MKRSITKILTLGPVSAQPEDIQSIAASLSFLKNHFHIDYLDSLSIMKELPNKEYYGLWKEKLANKINSYDAFFGFSFGGIILQQCFSLFEQFSKPIILFSTPTFANPDLIKKLGNVITLCEENQLEKALRALYEPVFYPNPIPESMIIPSPINQSQQAIKRLIFGLKRVLETDSRKALKAHPVDHLHFIGEYSNLVNNNNVWEAPHGRLVVVPKASMRVLQDNPAYCQKIILEALSDEAF